MIFARRGALVAGALVFFPGIARAQECATPDSAWVFCDDFESSQDQNQSLGLWDDQGLHPENLVLSSGSPHSGARSLQITAHKGLDTGGGPTKWFLPGYDVVFVRFWVRFSPGYNYLHHMVFIGASRAGDKWSAFGTAGCRPSGSNFFVTQIEPFSEWGKYRPPGAWGFYSYSNDMMCDPGSNCASYADPQAICDGCALRGSPCSNGLECCWGTNNVSSPPQISPLDAWSCLEGRVEANTGAQASGKQTLWFNDQLAGEWTGIRWRTDDTLKINSIGLWHYVTDDNYTTGQTEETVWFDDVVVSTSRIGCGQALADAGTNGSGGTTGGGGGMVANGGSRATAGATAAGGGSAGTGAAGIGGTSPSNGGTSNAQNSSSKEQGSCACRYGGEGRSGSRAWFLLLALAGAHTVRRRSARLRRA
ncbi:MAG TPA: MYXO-CTERM sorting domain-containing protein [Polyangiaceae bacterium]